MKIRKNNNGYLKEAIYEFEKDLIIRIYDENLKNQVKTAKILGINRNTLRGRLSEYGILSCEDEAEFSNAYVEKAAVDKIAPTISFTK